MEVEDDQQKEIPIIVSKKEISEKEKKEKKKDIDLFKSFANNEAVHASASSYDRTDR